jgi:phage-related protein
MNKVIQARFYKNAQGREPVRDWLLEMDADSRHAIGEDIRTVEKGWPMGMPVCRPLGNGLLEVRTNLKNTIARVLFCIGNNEMWLLHGFIKKTSKTPPQDLKLARQRKKELGI